MVAKSHSSPHADAERCRAELRAILASRLFNRAPSLSKMFSYICTKYLEGDLDSITEWSIAVEGLGRKASFDPEKDSIVRVEFYHLRKRLTQYYAAEGRDHKARITLPETGYIPRFSSLPSSG